MPDRATAEGQTVRAPGQPRWPIFLAAIALASLVGAVFWPIVGFEFVDFDTNDQVVENAHIQGLTLENLRHILTSRCITSYYPVRTLSYAVDHQLWGLSPGGFKLTNGLIHAGNVLLVLWLVLRLFHHPAVGDSPPAAWSDVAVATFSAGLFAVHPVVVEPVTWVPGREELLMALGALGCLHFYLTARRLDGDRSTALRRRACYTAAAFCCAAACLSNAVAAVIPLLITAWDALTLPKPRLRKILGGTSALWLIGAATVLIKGRDTPIEAVHTLPPMFSAQWLMLGLTVYWLNLKTLVWPTELGILYEWVPSYGFRNSELILGGLALALTPLLLWRLRRRTLILFGLVWFGLALAPTSEIIPHHICRADRFLYLPLVGLAVAAAAALRPLGSALKRPAAIAAAISAGLLALLLLVKLSADQVQTWRNSYSMWENCLRVSPNNPMAHMCFADILCEQGRFDKAIPHYHMSLRVEPDRISTLRQFALRLATAEDENLRDYELAIRLAKRGCELTEWKDPKLRHTLAMAYASSAASLQIRGDFATAIEHSYRAIDADPDYDVPLFNLAFLLATCRDRKLRRPEEAVRLAERGCELAGQPGPRRLSILAAAYAAAGRFEEAVATIDKAIQLAQAAGDRTMIVGLRRQRAAYQNGTPYQELPGGNHSPRL